MQTLIATPFDLMVELDDIGIDYESITNYQLFLLMMESIAANEENTEILFGNLDLKNFKAAKNTKNGERVFYDPTNDIAIDQMIALEICNAIRKIHFWEEWRSYQCLHNAIILLISKVKNLIHGWYMNCDFIIYLIITDTK